MGRHNAIKDDHKQHQQVLEHLLSLAKQHQATAEVSLDMDSGFSVDVRNADVETVEHHNGQSLALSLYKDQRVAHVSGTEVNQAASEQLFNKALTIVNYAEVDSCSGLAERELMAFNPPDLSLYHHWNMTPSEAIDLAISCEQEALAADARIFQSEGVNISSYNGQHWYGNSHDLLVDYNSSLHSINCSLIAKDAKGMQRDYEYSKARDASTLLPFANLAKAAALNTVHRLDARQIPTGTYPVVFHHRAAKSILGHFISAISGGRLYQKSSFLCDSLGKKVFSDNVSICQQPHIQSGISSAAFDSDGVRTQVVDYIQDGVLNSYALSHYSAKRLGLTTTGNAGGVYNCVLSMPTESFEDLLKQMGTGLLVTEMMGQGINLVTGDYSRGAFGYWVENGEIQHAVEEITIASTLQQMFAGLTLMGDDIDCRSSVHCGSILIDHMQVAGS